MGQKLNNYLKNAGGVAHITLDPYGPGVVRVHLVPPEKLKPGIPWVVILNGQDILPLNTSWAVLLRLFMEEADEREGYEVDDAEMDLIVAATVKKAREIFHQTPEKTLREDLSQIISTLCEIARGEEVTDEIGYMTLAQYAPYMRAPHRMDLMISAMEKDGAWNCNQQCLHCYAGRQPLACRKELTTEEWKTVIDRCRKACIPQLTFTGGEPTLRDDLPELVAHAAWFVTRLNTNGILLTETLCRDLREASLDAVQVTLYSDDPAVHNELVGADHFDDTIRGIRNAVAAGLNVSINTPLCTKNRDWKGLLRLGKELGVRYYTCSGLILTGEAAGGASAKTRLTSEELSAILEEGVAFARVNAQEVSFTSPGWLAEDRLHQLGLTVPSCGACLSNMAVAPDGTVIPCQSWLTGEGLGNLLEKSWKEIWKSDMCVSLRKYSAEWTQHCPRSDGAKEEGAKC